MINSETGLEKVFYQSLYMWYLESIHLFLRKDKPGNLENAILTLFMRM